MRYVEQARDTDCAIAAALGVVGDWWTLLVVRDIAGGVTRFDALHQELGISRRTLTERLTALVDGGVLDKHAYQDRPPRFEYRLTAKGRGLLPVLVALQDWGARHVLGDGSLTATTERDSVEARRMHELVGHTIPPMRLPSTAGDRDPVTDTAWTVLYCFPGAFAPDHHGYPPGWGQIPGARGCAAESMAYRDRLAEFARLDASVRGVSTQRADQLAGFAAHDRIEFPLLSDADLTLAAALRLPTFRAGGTDRLKRATLIADRDRTVRAVLYPVPDPVGSVDEVLDLITDLRG